MRNPEIVSLRSKFIKIINNKSIYAYYLKPIFLLIFFIISIFYFLPGVQADIISVNVGGGDEFVVNPDQYIEGFFFCNPLTCVDLGYTCGDWSDGCGRTMNCGTCGSGYTCTGGSCVAVPPSGNGGAGGGGAVVAKEKLF